MQAAEKNTSDAVSAEPVKTPERQITPLLVPPPIICKPSPESPHALLPPVNTVNIGRRVSLANGEAANLESWVAKRMASARPAGHSQPIRSPVMGQAAAARRNSIPYPSPVPEAGQSRSPNPMSPKVVSPSIRPMPSILHLTALRNNSRRASMPGAAQLISSGPFTPPRMVSGAYPMGSRRAVRELSPIKDHDGEVDPLHQSKFAFDETDFSTTYLTPPASTYLPSNTSPTSYFAPDSGSTVYDYPIEPSQQSPFTPSGPLPNPTFSFGSGPTQRRSVSMSGEEALLMAMQPRDRVGSMASINSTTTDGAIENGSDFGNDWLGLDGFDPETRRASAYVETPPESEMIVLLKRAVPRNSFTTSEY